MSNARRTQVRKWVTEKKYVTHKKGMIVHGPPGSGKSWFVEHLGKKQWVDVDEFLGQDYLNFHPEDWHSQKRSQNEIKNHYKECDRYLKAMRDEGLWVVGSLFWEFVPDAVVIIDEAQHKKWVAQRSDLTWSSAKKVRDFLEQQSQSDNVPVCTTWETVIKLSENAAKVVNCANSRNTNTEAITNTPQEELFARMRSFKRDAAQMTGNVHDSTSARKKQKTPVCQMDALRAVMKKHSF